MRAVETVLVLVAIASYSILGIIPIVGGIIASQPYPHILPQAPCQRKPLGVNSTHNQTSGKYYFTVIVSGFDAHYNLTTVDPPELVYFIRENYPDVIFEYPVKTMWDLIIENYYCDIAKALGMLYTIAFSTHGNGLPMNLCVYYDMETGYEYNLAIFDEGKYVINLLDGQIVNIDSVNEKFKLKHCYDSVKLKLQ